MVCKECKQYKLWIRALANCLSVMLILSLTHNCTCELKLDARWIPNRQRGTV
uniref:Uncharacterized protein n=1 Tax=Anguilla anguilla TaxID=7936 RepID=A0A0E9RPS0_ANGAN